MPNWLLNGAFMSWSNKPTEVDDLTLIFSKFDLCSGLAEFMYDTISTKRSSAFCVSLAESRGVLGGSSWPAGWWRKSAGLRWFDREPLTSRFLKKP
jgi:hypothetical protein